MKKVGFVGLGIMGKPMSKNLLKAGYELVVYDLNAAAVDEVVAAGAASAASCRAVAEQCETIITMLPNSPHVKQAVLSAGGVLEGMKPGALLIDMSSIAPLAAKEVAAALAEKGCEMLDAPVSGGEPKAIDGTLSIMVGGKPELFEQAKPIFDVLGSSAVLCGSIGAGNTTKLANQVVVALNIAALSEALLLGKCAGVEPEAIYQAIRGGLAGSTVMDAKAPMMLDGNIKPGFRVELHIKDLNNVLETGHAVGAPLPLTAQVMEMLNWLKSNGMGAADHSAIIRYYESLGNDTVKRG